MKLFIIHFNELKIHKTRINRVEGLVFDFPGNLNFNFSIPLNE